MRQKLTPTGCARLRQQICALPQFIPMDMEIVDKMVQGKAVYFWEATVMEDFCAAPLIQEGLRDLSPDPGWEIECAAMMLTSAADISLGLVEDLSDKVMKSFNVPAFTFGTAFADLELGTLRLILAVSSAPVRAPENITRLSLGELSLLIGGTRPERERLLGESTPFCDFTDALLNSVQENNSKAFIDEWSGKPFLALSEAQQVEGNEMAARMFSDILLRRFHADLPTVVAMQYLPLCFVNWFPIDKMRRDMPAPPPEDYEL